MPSPRSKDSCNLPLEHLISLDKICHQTGKEFIKKVIPSINSSNVRVGWFFRYLHLFLKFLITKQKWREIRSQRKLHKNHREFIKILNSQLTLHYFVKLISGLEYIYRRTVKWLYLKSKSEILLWGLLHLPENLSFGL